MLYGAVTTNKKKFTINYKHWFAIRNFETTKIRSLDIIWNNKTLPKFWFFKIWRTTDSLKSFLKMNEITQGNV